MILKNKGNIGYKNILPLKACKLYKKKQKSKIYFTFFYETEFMKNILKHLGYDVGNQANNMDVFSHVKYRSVIE